MSDIYEQKARKYKYKYLKLKQKYFGEGGMSFNMFKSSQSEDDKVNEIKDKLKNMITLNNSRIKEKYEKFCYTVENIAEATTKIRSNLPERQGFIYGTLNDNGTEHYCHANMFDIKSITDKFGRTNYPEILKYFFNIKDKWIYDHYKNKYNDATFTFDDLQKLTKHLAKYPHYNKLITLLNNDPKLQQTTNFRDHYNLKDFYKTYIRLIVKNLDIYLIVMLINDLFTKSNLKDKKYENTLNLVKNLVYAAESNEINGPDHLSTEIQKIIDSIPQ
jgi:hypothetical protein